MSWRQQIVEVGPSKIANAMNVKYPTVYKYIRPGSKTVPRDKLKDLCAAMALFLSQEDIEQFRRSLALEKSGFM